MVTLDNGVDYMIESLGLKGTCGEYQSDPTFDRFVYHVGKVLVV